MAHVAYIMGDLFFVPGVPILREETGDSNRCCFSLHGSDKVLLDAYWKRIQKVMGGLILDSHELPYSILFWLSREETGRLCHLAPPNTMPERYPLIVSPRIATANTKLQRYARENINDKSHFFATAADVIFFAEAIGRNPVTTAWSIELSGLPEEVQGAQLPMLTRMEDVAKKAMAWSWEDVPQLFSSAVSFKVVYVHRDRD